MINYFIYDTGEIKENLSKEVNVGDKLVLISCDPLFIFDWNSVGEVCSTAQIHACVTNCQDINSLDLVGHYNLQNDEFNYHGPTISTDFEGFSQAHITVITK